MSADAAGVLRASCAKCGLSEQLGHDMLCTKCRMRSLWPVTTGQASGRSAVEWETHLLKLSQKASPHLWPEECAELAALIAHLRALAAQAEAGDGEAEKMRYALRNLQLLANQQLFRASRGRDTSEAWHTVKRFCEEGGMVSSPLRAALAAAEEVG